MRFAALFISKGPTSRASGEIAFETHREYRGKFKARRKTHDGIVFL
jgi:hypothetical protein